MSQNRNRWLDIAKGIAIILMVAGHTPIPSVMSHFIYAFHMPLFFISSGLVSNYEKYSLVDYIKHKHIRFYFHLCVTLLLLHF